MGKIVDNGQFERYNTNTMNTNEIFFSTLLLMISLVSTAVATLVWRRRQAPGAKALAVFMVGIIWWSITYALFWANVPPSRLFWLNATYFGPVIVTPAFLIFTLQFTHREKWLNRSVFALLTIMPVLTIIFLWTDPWHGLFYGGQATSGESAIFSGGPWFWTNVVYSYLLNLLAIILLFKSYLSSHSLYRRQIGLVLAAAFIPWLSNIMSLVSLNPLPALDLTPISFMITGIIMAFALFQFRFLDVVPIARDKLIESMKDGILVLDKQSRVVDANPTMAALLGRENASIIGQNAAAILPGWPQLQVLAEKPDDVGHEIQLPGNSSAFLHLRVFSLTDQRGNEQGKLIILQNITVRKKLEAEREELIDTLQKALGEVKTLSGLLPICANCKKIRDDQGYWQDVAVYVRDHSEAEFTHGMCPECMEAYYPETFARQIQ